MWGKPRKAPQTQKRRLGFLQDGVFVKVSEHYFHGETAFEEVNVRLYTSWWRRGESNPCPKKRQNEFLRAQSLFKHSLCLFHNDKEQGSVAPYTVSLRSMGEIVPHIATPDSGAVGSPGPTSSTRPLLQIRYSRLMFKSRLMTPRGSAARCPDLR